MNEAPAPALPRLLVLVVAYNAESTIESVMSRVPKELCEQFDLELLVLDDCSGDSTFVRGARASHGTDWALPTTVLRNPTNRGYGGNQKIGFEYAIQMGFDFVVLLHGDGQYAPERLPDMLAPLISGAAEAVMGSRMLAKGGARQGGMPLYKLVGKRILTGFQNKLLSTDLSEFHSGYRAYSVPALAALPFKLNTDDFHFDTEILIQLFLSGRRVAEVEIPTYYGDEICYVNGLQYARNVALTTTRASLQRFGIFYDPKFDVFHHEGPSVYEAKLDFESPSSVVLEQVGPGERVVDIGCGAGELDERLRDRGCNVVGIDKWDQDPARFERFVKSDLDADPLPVDLGEFDTVLLLDVIEHLSSPEKFMEGVREAIWAKDGTGPRITASTGNVAFLPLRAALTLGQFNYGQRGILDMTHRRLFTLRSFRRLFEQSGFVVERLVGIPPPLPMVGGSIVFRAGFRLGSLLAHRFRSLFAYQFVVIAHTQRSLGALLKDSQIEANRMRVSRGPTDMTHNRLGTSEGVIHAEQG
jgi:2-polyprenyl-3-methyl-5-hydroxy-6-metoxy-1,4-benzoquinol methylase